jgi:hypothetical protein
MRHINRNARIVDSKASNPTEIKNGSNLKPEGKDFFYKIIKTTVKNYKIHKKWQKKLHNFHASSPSQIVLYKSPQS